jgi:hypothetical protein
VVRLLVLVVEQHFLHSRRWRRGCSRWQSTKSITVARWNGGNGSANSYSGSSVTYAGGGGGAVLNGGSQDAGDGGTGGGGGASTTANVTGTAMAQPTLVAVAVAATAVLAA